MSTNTLKLICFALVLTIGSSLFAQNKTLLIEIKPEFNNEVVLKNKWYITKNNDSIKFSKLKFYLTDFKIKTKKNKEHSIPNSNYLIDAFTKETLSFNLLEINYQKGDQLLFNIGVKEEMNTSGALSGDLDPANGMYWSWQSGYINFKMEGYSPSCKTRKNKFQFHIGGYKKPYKTTRHIKLDIEAINNNLLNISLSVDEFFNLIDLSKENQIMIPGKEANDLADILPTLFSKHE